MELRRAVFPALAALLVAALALAPFGCGGTSSDLSHSSSATTPVVTFSRPQAISPVYNPTTPVTIIYGDGKVIEKHGPYELTSGVLSAEELDALLESLSDEGFFELKQEYVGEPMPGGVTEVLEVNLTDKTHKVTVQGGQGPSNWEGIINTVTAISPTGSGAYLPDSIRLYAKAEPSAPSAPNVMTWPGDSEDLARASSESNGVELEGERAKVAWKAIGESMEKGDEVVWKAGDGFYTFVHASPIFPGIAEQS